MTVDEEFGSYRLERRIGHGGMGEVFKAYDTSQDREVALKRLLPHMAGTDEFRQRFRRESRTVARLRNPHVIPIHSYGEIDGRLFIDMRLVDGRDLERLLDDDGRLPAERAVRIIVQVAGALESAHREGLVHRDVKPSNILLDRDSGDEDFVYLADFGITRASSGPSRSLTASDVVVGSLQYMAPEQFDGTAGVAADIYSLGCVFFQCLTGTTPFEVDGFPALMKAHTDSPPPAPSRRCRDVSAAFDEVVRRAMAKEPAERHATAAEFAKDVRGALDRATADPRTTTAPGPTRPRPTLSFTGPSSAHSSDPPPTDPPTSWGHLATALAPPRPPESDTETVPSSRARASGPTVVPSGTRGGAGRDGPPPTTPGPAPGPTGRGGGGRRRLVALLVAALVAAVVVAVGVVVANGGDRAPSGPVADSVVAPSDTAPAAPAASLDQALVAATYPTNGPPETVAISPDGRSAYLTITGDRPALEVLDVATGRVIDDVPVPGPPYFVGVSPEGDTVYVTYYDRTQDQLVIGTMDTRVGALDGAIPTGQRADQGGALTWLFGFAVSPVEPHLLYVPNMNAGTVSVLDPDQRRAVGQIPVPASPHWVALSPDGRFGYVTNHVPGQVTVIDIAQNRTVASIPVGPGMSPHSIAVSPDGRMVEEVNYDGDSLTLIDPATNTIVGTTGVGEGPQSIAFAPDGAHSYVVNEDSHTVSVIGRDGRVTGTAPAGDGASMIAVTPDGRKAVVADKESNDVTVLDVGAGAR